MKPILSNSFGAKHLSPENADAGPWKDFAMQLPDRPNLRHLRDQAKKLVRSNAVPTLAEAQLQIARQYGYPSWAKLKDQVETREKAGLLKQAIATGELTAVKTLLAQNSDLRLLLIEELMCASQPGQSAKMEFLVHAGADVNGLCWGWYPVLFCPCENLQPEPLKWLLDHGADPNCARSGTGRTALDYVIDTYPRAPKQLTACIELLLAAGARTRYDVPGVLPILRNRTAELAALLETNPSLVHRRYPELVDCGQSGGRLLTLRGSTLLHVAAEYGFLDATRLLLDRGANVNARADVDVNGVGGQTPIFHALTHFKGVNPEVGELLVQRGADLTIRARVPGHYERKGEVLDVTAAEYAALFPLR